MKDSKSDKLKILLEQKADKPFTDSELIEAENCLLGFFETLIEIARENPDLIKNKLEKNYTH